MLSPLIERYIAPPEATVDRVLRGRVGIAAAIGGLVVNLLLALVKGLIGFFSGSVAILGDAVNNATDALVNILTLASFKLAGMPADKRHPYGHARLEYVFATLMGAVILFVGAQILFESIHKMRHPEIISWRPLLFLILLLSILGKLLLWKYYKELDERIDSTLLRAAAVDSLGDIWATLAILVSLVLSPLVGFDFDGPMGLIVALIILKAGWEILRDTVDKLLGESPDIELMEKLRQFVLAYPGIHGVHDLILHDYGPGIRMATLHAEVDSKVSAMDSHALIDRIEIDLQQTFDIPTTIHMDPLDLDDPRTNELHALVLRIVHDIDPTIRIHDFRIVEAFYTTNLVFDLSVPAACPMSDERIETMLRLRLSEVDPPLLPKVHFDPLYIQN